MKKRVVHRALIAVLLLSAALFAGYVLVFDDVLLVHSLQTCESVPRAERFSCFRAQIETHAEKDLEGYMSRLNRLAPEFTKTGDNSYAVFGTNCHTFYHALGDFAAMHAEGRSVKELIKLGDMRCAAGYVMGLFKRLTYENNYQGDYLSQMYPVCPPAERNSCAHELGHDLYDKHAEPILALLDGITHERYGVRLGSRAAHERGAVDLAKPFEECRAMLPEHEWPYCFTGVGHGMFLFGEFNPDGYLAELDSCTSIEDREGQEECNEFLIYRIGVNYAAPLFLSSSFDEAETVCDEAAAAASTPNTSAYLEQCYLGVGGGVGLYVDSELLSVEPEPEDIPRLKETLIRYAHLCNRVPEVYGESCYLGLLGTNFLDAYLKFRMSDSAIEGLVPYVGNYEVVG